jgi:hypothetical protein
MRHWLGRCAGPRTCVRAVRLIAAPAARIRPAASTQRNIPAFSTAIVRRATDRQTDTAGAVGHFRKLRKWQPPEGAAKDDADAWLYLLEAGLPPHLSECARPEAGSLSIRDLAEILLAAQNHPQPAKAIDLLFHLGHEKGRWAAVVWLVKRLVEAFGPLATAPSRLRHVGNIWSTEYSLDAITNDRNALSRLTNTALLGPNHVHASLDLLTKRGSDRTSHEGLFAHRALGQIWRSLGKMTMACVDTEITPEVLEIIAYLHTMEIMPSSIYSQKPATDATSVQQPPILNLLSSRILISLSDAAWRAHERSLTLEAFGGQYTQLRTAAPKSRHRISVAGIRPEVWLELLLWSCLHGGWVSQGLDILRMLYEETASTMWRPLSWRSIIPENESSNPDWDKLEYAFNTRLPSMMDATDTLSDVSVHRTVSSEVVNAYVDALPSSTRSALGEPGLAPGNALEQLNMLRKFLARNHLSLVGGSWDAILLRLADAHEHLVEQDESQFRALAVLSPMLGEELNLSEGSNVPEYVLDGTAAQTGLYHRALRSRINAGDVLGSFRLFQGLQERADLNKRRSLVDLTQNRQLAGDKSASECGMFTSNFSGIEYPAFAMHIPPTILGPFLQLVIDSKAFKLAWWLLNDRELDGAVIPLHSYAEPPIAPALIRLAAETNNKTLFTNVVSACKARASAQGFTMFPEYIGAALQSQLSQRKWASAAKMLDQLQSSPGLSLDVSLLAHVMRATLIEFGAEQAGDQDARQHLQKARDLLLKMLGVVHSTRSGVPSLAQEQSAVLLLVLAQVDPYWAEFTRALIPRKRYYTIDLPIKAFNTALEGIVYAYGACKGRNVVDVFWPEGIREAQQVDQDPNTGEPRMLRTGRRRHNHPVRSIVTLPTSPPEERVLYGGLKPDHATLSIIFYHALKEYKSSNGAPSDHTKSQEAELKTPGGSPALDLILWSVTNLHLLHMSEDDVLNQLNGQLFESDLATVQAAMSNNDAVPG